MTIKTKKISTHNLNSLKLPNGCIIKHINEYETLYLYEELFVNHTYAHPRIKLPEQPIILDIGANIGLFALYMKQKHPKACIYSFEPIKHTFSALKENMLLHNLGQPFQFGVTDQIGTQTFHHYPNATFFSGKYTSKDDLRKMKVIAKNILKKQYGLEEEYLDAYVSLFTKNRTLSIPESVSVTTITEIIHANKLFRIDLLKVDAEGCELEVLSGLSVADWPKIRTIIIEIHEQTQLTKEPFIKLLQAKGFTVAEKHEETLKNTGLCNLYAWRDET
jgi:FkbM family methyltransferase